MPNAYGRLFSAFDPRQTFSLSVRNEHAGIFTGCLLESEMRVKVDADRCQGHAMCTLACPDLFHLNDDDGHAFVVQEVVPEEFEDHVRQAQRGCPEDAIIITET